MKKKILLIQIKKVNQLHKLDNMNVINFPSNSQIYNPIINQNLNKIDINYFPNQNFSNLKCKRIF